MGVGGVGFIVPIAYCLHCFYCLYCFYCMYCLYGANPCLWNAYLPILPHSILPLLWANLYCGHLYCILPMPYMASILPIVPIASSLYIAYCI